MDQPTRETILIQKACKHSKKTCESVILFKEYGRNINAC